MKVVAIIVSFQPDAADAALTAEVRALQPQVWRTLIVDNGSDPEKRALLESLRAETVEIVQLGENRGVGAAHNAGIRRARELGASHVLLLDQDSLPQPEMVASLLAAEASLLARGEKVAAVGPVFHDARLGRSWPFYRLSRFGMQAQACTDAAIVPCDFLISSGSLMRIAALDAVGPMNEGYFLEHVDTEWALRALSLGHRLFGACNARMDHQLGDAAVAVPFSDRRVQLYQPYRHYYLFRNAVLLSREPYAPLPWKLNELRRLVLRIVFFPLFVAPRLERLQCMLLGLWHGIRGRTGRIPT
jgi:rhamnosyltransferase